MPCFWFLLFGAQREYFCWFKLPTEWKLVVANLKWIQGQESMPCNHWSSWGLLRTLAHWSLCLPKETVCQHIQEEHLLTPDFNLHHLPQSFYSLKRNLIHLDDFFSIMRLFYFVWNSLILFLNTKYFGLAHHNVTECCTFIFMRKRSKETV